LESSKPACFTSPFSSALGAASALAPSRYATMDKPDWQRCEVQAPYIKRAPDGVCEHTAARRCFFFAHLDNGRVRAPGAGGVRTCFKRDARRENFESDSVTAPGRVSACAAHAHHLDCTRKCESAAAAAVCVCVCEVSRYTPGGRWPAGAVRFGTPVQEPFVLVALLFLAAACGGAQRTRRRGA